MSNLSIYQISGIQFAAGLDWNTASKPGDSREATSIKDAFDADYLVMRKTGSQEIGLGYEEKGHETKMPSAALAIIDAVYSNIEKRKPKWHALFKDDNGKFVHIKVIEGIISPKDGDVFYKTEKEAIAVFNKTELSGWDASYCNFNSEFLPHNLDKVITDIDWEAILKNTPALSEGVLSNKKFTTYVVGAAAVCSVLYMGFSVVPGYVEDLLKEETITSLASEELPPITVLPLEQDPQEFLTQCMNAYNDLDIRPLGWEFNYYHCTANSPQAQWSWGHSSSRKSIKRQFAEREFKKHEQLSSGVVKDSRAIAKFIFANFYRPAVQEIPHITATRKAVDQLLGPISDGITIAETKLSKPVVLEPQDQSIKIKNNYNLPIQNLGQYKISFNTSFGIEELIKRSTIPGLEYDSVFWDPSTRKWKIEGRIRKDAFSPVIITGEFYEKTS